MSPKRKAKQPPASISIGGNVKGIGIVIGNNSKSDVSVSSATSSSRHSASRMLWSRLAAFLIALVGVFAAVGVFVRLLKGFDSLLVAELVLAGLVSALGVSGFLKPEILADLFGKIFDKK